MLHAVIRCPRCSARIDLKLEITCDSCGQHYPRLGAVPILLGDPESYLRSCRAQLGLLEQQTDRTVKAIEQQLHAADVLETTKARCRAMSQAIRDQTLEIKAILEPVVGPSVGVASGEIPAPLQYIHYLYRDWGWPSSPDGENERVLSLIDTMLQNGCLAARWSLVLVRAAWPTICIVATRRRKRSSSTSNRFSSPALTRLFEADH